MSSFVDPKRNYLRIVQITPVENPPTIEDTPSEQISCWDISCQEVPSQDARTRGVHQLLRAFDGFMGDSPWFGISTSYPGGYGVPVDSCYVSALPGRLWDVDSSAIAFRYMPSARKYPEDLPPPSPNTLRIFAQGQESKQEVEACLAIEKDISDRKGLLQ